MTIRLIWALPLIAPFAVWTFARVFWAFAGLPWEVDPAAAGMVIVFAPIAGGVAAAALQDNGIHWNVTIGGQRNDP